MQTPTKINKHNDAFPYMVAADLHLIKVFRLL